MKSTFRILLFIMTITFCGVNAYAQKDNRQRMTREQLAETQAKYKTFGHLVPDLKEILQTARKLKRNRRWRSAFRIAKRY